MTTFSAWSQISPTVYGNPELSDRARMVSAYLTAFREACDPAEEFNLGKRSGDQVAFRIYGRISGTADTALNETDKVPFLTLPVYHGTGQVYRYGAALSFTGVLEDLDRLDVNSANIKALREHAARTDNKLIYTEAVAARSFTYVPLTSSTYDLKTDGTVASTYAADMSLFHARKIAEKMQTYNAPYFDGQNYLGVFSTQARFAFLNDTGTNGFVDVSKYAPGRAEGIIDNEVGTVGQIRVIADNSTVLSNTLGSGSKYGEGFVFGAEAVKEILVYPMHFRANLNLGGDFGNQRGICWQAMLGFKGIWNYTTHGQGSILHITSV